jgi:hypothetical protein
MNPDKEQKIKGLIQTSTILTQFERVEWLGLLEIMNDKQVLELEKILESELVQKESWQLPNQKSSSSSITSPSPSSARRGIEEQGAGKQAPQETPNINKATTGGVSPSSLLQNLTAQKSNTPSKTSPLPNPPPQGEETKQQGNKFASQLKNILNEKELTTSKPEYPLEISGGVRKEAQKPAPAKPQPPVIPKVIPLKPSENQVVNQEEYKPEPAKKPTEFLKKEDKSPVIGWKDLLSNAAKDSFKATNVQTGLSKLPNFKNLDEVRKPVLEKPVEGPAPTKPSPVATPPPKLQKPILKSPSRLLSEKEKRLAYDMNNLQDVSAMTVSWVRNIDIEELAKRIRSLMIKHGFHNVMFALEKSPLYISYLSTGAEVLKQESSFEGISGTSLERYLSKEEFESFTDLLTQIQAD